jgi:hypothetical protein
MDDDTDRISMQPANPPRRNSAIGKVAFEAYTAQAGGKTHDGKPIPAWEALTDSVRASWTAAARAVEADVRRPADPPKPAEVPTNAGPPTAHQG